MQVLAGPKLNNFLQKLYKTDPKKLVQFSKRTPDKEEATILLEVAKFITFSQSHGGKIYATILGSPQDIVTGLKHFNSKKVKKLVKELQQKRKRAIKHGMGNLAQAFDDMISIADQAIIASSLQPEILLQKLQECADDLDVGTETSLIRRIDDSVRASGYTGTKMHENVVKAIGKINDGREMLYNIIESLKEDIEEQQEFARKEAEEEAAQQAEFEPKDEDEDIFHA